MKKIILASTLIFFTGLLIAQQVIPLWEDGAPGFESRRSEPEQAKDWWVKNIHNPSLTAFFPEKPNGTAIIVCPGGGHRELVYNAEGVDAATYLTKLGVTVFVLKYRLAREEGSPYSLETHVKEDARQAIRIVRKRAGEWNLDQNKIGMMGFSAGGEVVSMVAYEKLPKDIQINFQILIYPGPLYIPDVVPADSPRAFMLAANDDVCCSGPIVKLLTGYKKAGLPVEVHLYAKGDHGFNMGNRSSLKSISSWPDRLRDWLSDSGLL